MSEEKKDAPEEKIEAAAVDAPSPNEAKLKRLLMMAIIAGSVIILALGGFVTYLLLKKPPPVKVEIHAAEGEEGKEKAAEGEAKGGEHDAKSAEHDTKGKEDAKGGEHGAKDAKGSSPFYELPDILVNLNSANQRRNFLKIKIFLEVEKPEDTKALEKIQPRLIDQLQIYLRELKIADLQGAHGAMRLREDLLVRVKAVSSPIVIKQVLFKDLLIQ